MKNIIKYILQKTFGLNNYLYLFARFMICKLPWDKNENDFIRFLNLIEDSGHVLDIGANIGVMTYHFSKKLKKSVIHSFEPVPINFSILDRIVRQFKLLNVKTYPIALGDKDDEVNMILPQYNQVYLHGLSHVEKSKNEDSGKVFKVQMKKLDNLVELQRIEIKAIKLDVEEYEYFVLKGATKLIQKSRPLIYIELWDSENKKQSFKYLTDHDYKAFVNQKGNLIEYSGQLKCQNFFFIPKDRVDKLNLL